MKKIAKVLFKIHRFIYKYPTRSEIRLALETSDFIDTNWYICMLYICDEPIDEIARLIDISEDKVKERLNQAASVVDL